MIAYNTSIVRDGLVLHLDAANVKSYPGSGTVWKDLSGNGNNGTLVNGVGYRPDNNGAMVFDGINDYSIIPYTPILAPTTGITLSAWANINWQTTSNARILSKTESGGWQLSTNDDPAGNKLGLTIHIGGIYRFVTISKTAVSPGYHNLLGTFDGIVASLYIDGVVVNSLNLGSPMLLTYSYTNSLIIGAEAGVSGSANTNFINGSIPQVAIYNRALTAQEIQQNFEATRGRYGI